MNLQRVGTATITFDTDVSAQITYSANGVSGSYNLVRYNVAPVDVGSSALYYGAEIVDNTNCPFLGTVPAVFGISQSNTELAITMSTTGGTCTFAGPYTQFGNRLLWSGARSCTPGFVGTFANLLVAVGQRSFSILGPFVYSGVFGPCEVTGNIGGVN